MTGRIWLGALAAAALSGCGERGADERPANEQPGAVTAPPLTPSASSQQIEPAAAAAQRSLGDSESQNGRFRMSVIEATRAGGGLTVKARFTLLAGETGRTRLLYPSDYDEVYVVAGDQKYMILRDNERAPLAPEDYMPGFARLGSSSTWWGKFPAPPPEVKAVGFFFKDFAPVENVTITDR